MVHCCSKFHSKHFKVNPTWHLNQPNFNKYLSLMLSSRCLWASTAWRTARVSVWEREEREGSGWITERKEKAQQSRNSEMPFAITFELYHNSNLARSMLQSIEKPPQTYTTTHKLLFNLFLSYFLLKFVFIQLIQGEKWMYKIAWCQLWKLITEFNYWVHLVYPDKA